MNQQHTMHHIFIENLVTPRGRGILCTFYFVSELKYITHVTVLYLSSFISVYCLRIFHYILQQMSVLSTVLHYISARCSVPKPQWCAVLTPADWFMQLRDLHSLSDKFNHVAGVWNHNQKYKCRPCTFTWLIFYFGFLYFYSRIEFLYSAHHWN